MGPDFKWAIGGCFHSSGLARKSDPVLREIPAVKVLHADKSKRIVLPSPDKPLLAWMPVLVTEKEIRLIAYEAPEKPSLAKGKVVMGKDGWPVWEGEMVMDPVTALNHDRAALTAFAAGRSAPARRPATPRRFAHWLKTCWA